MNDQSHNRNRSTGKRGAFINSIWHCDCEPRMPAEKFQTKNGGKNHGRWFYTCQKAQHKRCKFFLWLDDAQPREKAAVLGNSKTEPHGQSAPQTPHKSRVQAEPLTPFSKTKTGLDESISYSRRKDDDSQGTIDFEREESFDWSSSGDERLVALADETPRKAIKTAQHQTPGHRTDGDAIFKTPETSNKPTGLMSPLNTASRVDHVPRPSSSDGGMVAEVLEVLKPANIPTAVEERVVQLLNRYELRAQGIAKGRDITRLAVQTKERKIAELQARISTLEADRETSRTVIAYLKQDIATSPKRPRRP